MKLLYALPFLVATVSCSPNVGSSDGGCPDDMYCQHESLIEVCESAVSDFYNERVQPSGEDPFIDLFCQDWYDQHYGGPDL